jgi:hypothetical protein
VPAFFVRQRRAGGRNGLRSLGHFIVEFDDIGVLRLVLILLSRMGTAGPIAVCRHAVMKGTRVKRGSGDFLDSLQSAHDA